MSPSYPYNLRANAASSVEAPALLLGQFPSSLPYAWHPPMPEGSLSDWHVCLPGKSAAMGPNECHPLVRGPIKESVRKRVQGKAMGWVFSFSFVKLTPLVSLSET